MNQNKQPQDHKRRKSKKEEMKQQVVGTFEEELKKNYIKSLIQGGEICANEILELINNGGSLEDVKHHCEMTIKSSQDGTMEKVANK